jgi:hypothetical protein
MKKTCTAVLLFIVTSVSGPAAELSLALKAGAFFPSQDAFRSVYGNGYPLGGDVRLVFGGLYGFSAGYESLGIKGAAVPLDGGEDILPLRFASRSLRFAVSLLISSTRPVLTASAGAVRCSFSESWATLPELDYRDAVWGPFAMFAVEMPLAARIGVLAEIRYENLDSGAGSAVERAVKLGGFYVSAGLVFRVF